MAAEKKKKIPEKFPDYPLWIPLVYWVFNVAVLVLGYSLLSLLNPYAAYAYALLYFSIVVLSLPVSCRYCGYYGATCGAGLGRLVPFFFKKGDVSKFDDVSRMKKFFMFQILVSFLPVAGGLVFLLGAFSYDALLLLFVYLVFATVGNAVLHKNLVCCRCGMLECGRCPMERIFEKEA